MIDLFWLFVGVLTGLFVVAVFIPPNHTDTQLPSVGDTSVFRTPVGCVKFQSEEVNCSPNAKSLASTK